MTTRKSRRKGAGGATGEGGGASSPFAPKDFIPPISDDIPSPENIFDKDAYEAERHQAAMIRVSRMMEDARYKRRVVVESVNEGWDPHRSFLSRNHGLHAWGRRRYK
jgi:hypothetical protein